MYEKESNQPSGEFILAECTPNVLGEAIDPSTCDAQAGRQLQDVLRGFNPQDAFTVKTLLGRHYFVEML